MESRPAAEAPGGPGSCRRHLRRHRHLGEGALVGTQLQAGLHEPEPVRLHGDGLAGQEQQNRLERLLHHVALLGGVDAHHEGVGREGARSDSEHDAAPGEVVEQHHAVSQHERVVVGQRRDAGAEPDVPGALRGGGDEDLGRGDDLVAGGVVLAEPGLVEAELVEVLDQLQVAFEGEGGVLAHRVERGQEDPELQAAVGVDGGHGPPGVRGVGSGAAGQGVTRILPCSPGVRSVSNAPGAPARSTVEVTRRSAPGTPVGQASERGGEFGRACTRRRTAVPSPWSRP